MIPNSLLSFWAVRRLARLSRFLVILGGLSALSAFLLLLVSGKVVGPGVSFYQQYPSVFWLLLAFTYTCGVLSALTEPPQRKFTSGIHLAVLSNVAFLLVPFVLGYFAIDPHDSTSNLGYVTSLLNTGHVFVNDFYPAYHLLMSMANLLTRIPSNSISLMSLPLLYVLYLLSIVSLSRVLGLKARTTKLFLVAASPIIYPEILVSIPRTFVFSLFPLLLGLVVLYRKRNRSRRDLLALVLLVLVMVVSHPLNGGPLVFIPVVFALIIYGSPAVDGIKSLFISSLKSLLDPVIFVWSLIWVGWVASFTVLGIAFQALLQLISGLSYFTQATTTVQSSGLPSYFVAEIILKDFGPNMAYVTIGLILSVLMIFRTLRGERLPRASLLMATLLLIMVLWLAYSFVSPIGLTFWRVTPYILLPSAGLIAIVASQSKPKLAAVLLLLLVTSGEFTAMAAWYGSSWTSTVSVALYPSDALEMKWFATHEITTTPLLQVWIPAYPLLVALEGEYFPAQNIVGSSTPPDHLLYNSSMVGEGAYLILPAYSSNWYPSKFPSFESAWRYTPEDVSQLQASTRVEVVYSNPTEQLMVLVM